MVFDSQQLMSWLPLLILPISHSKKHTLVWCFSTLFRVSLFYYCIIRKDVDFNLKHFFETSNFWKKNIGKSWCSNQRDTQINTIWHWLLLLLFGLFAYGSIYQQMLLIGVFIGIAALVNGPFMLLWGAIYSALIAFFPPLAILVSILFFLINLGSVVRSWRISLTSTYFYVVPLVGTLIQAFVKNEPRYLVLLFIALEMIGLHFLLNWLYQYNSLSRSLMWRIISVPYSFLLMILPARFHGPLKRNNRIKR